VKRTQYVKRSIVGTPVETCKWWYCDFVYNSATRNSVVSVLNGTGGYDKSSYLKETTAISTSTYTTTKNHQPKLW